MYKTCLLILLFFLTIFYSHSNENGFDTDINKFYELKKEAKALKKDDSFIIQKMIEYYLKSSEKNPESLNKRLKYNSKKLNNSTVDFVIHAMVVIHINLTKNDRATITPIMHSLELKLPSIKNKKLLTEAELVIGAYYQFICKNELSRLHTFKALEYSKETNNHAYSQTSNFNIAVTYYYDKKYKESEYFLLKALSYEKFGFSDGHYNKMMLLAGIKEARGNIDGALKVMLELTDMVPAKGEGAYYNNLGELYIRLSDWKNAIIILKKAEEILEKENSVALEYVYTNLASCYSELNDYKNSYKYTILKEDIIKKQQKQASLLELEQLKKEEAVKTEKLEKKIILGKLNLERTKKIQLYIVLSFVLMLLLSLFFFAIRIKSKNRLLVKMSLSKIENNFIKNETVKKVLPDLVEKFEKVFYDKEIFKDPDLTVQKLAKKLGTNAKDLSQTINNHYNCPFRDLINEKRIDLAKTLLIDNDYLNYSMEGIANSVGYKSKSMFYAHFKNLTGVTPANFQKYALEELKR